MQLQREVNHRRCSVGIWLFHSFNQLTNRYLLAVCRFQDMLDLKVTKVKKTTAMKNHQKNPIVPSLLWQSTGGGWWGKNSQCSSVQSLRCVRLFVTPWTSARQASLSITNSRSLLKLMPIELVMPPSHLILCHPLLLLLPIPPSIRVFSNESAWGDQSTGVSASASVLPMNAQDWSPLGWTGWISLQSKGLSRVFSNTTVQKHQFFGVQLSSQSNSHVHIWLLEKP